jgi:hypothetical protein
LLRVIRIIGKSPSDKLGVVELVGAVTWDPKRAFSFFFVWDVGHGSFH